MSGSFVTLFVRQLGYKLQKYCFGNVLIEEILSIKQENECFTAVGLRTKHVL
jgi:hypothetical protein